MGSFLSPVREVGAPFDEVVISWTGTAAPASTVRFLLRARTQDVWTDWYTMAVWRDGQTASVRGQRDAAGQVDIDTLKLSSMADALQIQVDLEATADSPAIRSVTAVAADTTVAPFGPGLVEGSAWGIDLPVPARSQLLQDPTVAREICSPTSLTMVLAYWGVGLPVMDVVRGVRDGTTRIFGNWPANTVFASSLGFDAWVDRCYSLAQIEAEIALGRPVITSQRWGAGELPGAWLNSTSGHLMVVRGFTESGDVVVNDPFAPSEQGVRRIYSRDAFGRVWLRSGGVVYRIVPVAD